MFKYLLLLLLLHMQMQLLFYFSMPPVALWEPLWGTPTESFVVCCAMMYFMICHPLEDFNQSRFILLYPPLEDFDQTRLI